MTEHFPRVGPRGWSGIHRVGRKKKAPEGSHPNDGINLSMERQSSMHEGSDSQSSDDYDGNPPDSPEHPPMMKDTLDLWMKSIDEIGATMRSFESRLTLVETAASYIEQLNAKLAAFSNSPLTLRPKKKVKNEIIEEEDADEEANENEDDGEDENDYEDESEGENDCQNESEDEDNSEDADADADDVDDEFGDASDDEVDDGNDYEVDDSNEEMEVQPQRKALKGATKSPLKQGKKRNLDEEDIESPKAKKARVQVHQEGGRKELVSLSTMRKGRDRLIQQPEQQQFHDHHHHHHYKKLEHSLKSHKEKHHHKKSHHP